MSEQEWHGNLPDELKNAPIFKPAQDGTIKSVEQVVLDLNNLAQVAGNSLRMPGPDAGDDDIKAFHTKVMEKVPGLMVLPNMEDEANLATHFTKLGKPATPEGKRIKTEEIIQDPDDVTKCKYKIVYEDIPEPPIPPPPEVLFEVPITNVIFLATSNGIPRSWKLKTMPVTNSVE